MTYQVTADIRYIDGPLSGLVLPAGYRTTWETMESATHCARWLNKVMGDRDFVRAAVTGHKYRVVSSALIYELTPA